MLICTLTPTNGPTCGHSIFIGFFLCYFRMSSIHITSQNNTSEGERRLFTYVHWTKITLSHVNILWWKTNTHRHAHQEKKNNSISLSFDYGVVFWFLWAQGLSFRFEVLLLGFKLFFFFYFCHSFMSPQKGTLTHLHPTH